MLFWLYRIIVFVAYALAFPFLGVLALSGSVKWRNRLGRGFSGAMRNQEASGAGANQLFWAHAASAGEARALANFVRAYCKRHSEARFMVTVVTDTGYDTACDALAELVGSGVVLVRYLPLDCPQSIHKALRRLRPDLFVFTETEIWPNWTAALMARKVPFVLINARLTERSLRRYHRAHSFLKRTMRRYELVICQAPEHVERFRALGAPTERLCVSGNLKIDAPLSDIPAERKTELRRLLGAADSDYLIVCGSIRGGECTGALQAFQRLSARYPRLCFALAPRHLERCADIMAEARGLGINTRIFSEQQRAERNNKHHPESDSQSDGKPYVTVVDVFGVLRELYGAADLAFVGGTMIPVGGHNILEPPQVGTPVFFGPYTANVTEGAELALKRNCGLQVAGWPDFAAQLERVMQGELTFGEWDADATQSESPALYTVDKIETFLARRLKNV